MAERAFQTQLIRFGAGGLNLRLKPDIVPPNQLTRYTNALRLRTGSVTSRAGETVLTNAPAAHTTLHSISRMDNALAGTYQRIWGIDADLYYGVNGALTLADSGYSGDPLTMIVADPPIPGAPWTYIADRSRMRKIRADGLNVEIGLPLGVLRSALVGMSTLTNTIEPFTAVAGWTGYTDPFDPSAGVPTFGLVADPPATGNALQITTDPGTDPAEYTNFADLSVGPLDLSNYAAVTPPVPATDDDFMHLWIQPDANVTGVFIYLTSGAFTPGTVPGTVNGVNSAAVRAVINFPPTAAGVWNEYGVVALPLKRSDFTQAAILFSQPMDWANVTGLSIRIAVSTNVAATVAFWDFTEVSARPSAPVVNPYDYRVTNYDPRTGVEGNPSPVQPQANWLFDLGTFVIITPNAYGDAAVRQRAYRRGGDTGLANNWYFIGQNTSDGGPIYDSLTDAAIAAGPTVAIDHDQPVTSLNTTTGATILNQPVPIIFGPVNGLYFALGDRNQPSTIYWTLEDAPDYWPAVNTLPVCAAGEPLETGCVWGGEGYVASNKRWFRLLPNLSNANEVLAQPSGATKGVISRWAMVVGPKGVEYISDDGWYLHTGGGQENLSDTEMYPLFNGVTANDHLPIDFSHPEALRMGTVLNEVWLVYQNTAGTRECLVRNTLTNEFRIVSFDKRPAVVVGEIENPADPPKLLLIGGATTARAYTHTGTSDDGTAIAAHVRTAALDQSFPRQLKQYGDVTVKAQLNGATIALTTFLDDESVALAPVNVPGSGVTVLDPFGGTPTEGRNVSLDLAWSTTGTPPILDFAGPSYFVQPESTVDRISDWDDGGAPGEKYLKGCVIDVDTAGVPKTVDVEATLYDGTVTVVATLNLTANGRRKLTFTWNRTAVSFMRLRPTDAVPWTRWAWQWIFDEEPLALNRWETEPEDFALAGWKTITQMYLTLRTTSPVTLTVTAFYDNGGVVVETYTIPSTSGVKQSRWVTFRAGKGVLYQFVFTSDDGSRWRLYREETTLWVQPLPGDAVVRHPFGNDDLDLVRGVQSAEGTALAPGGGEG